MKFTQNLRPLIVALALLFLVPKTNAQWNLNGNAINSGVFLGSTNNAPLEFRRNNIPVFRIDELDNFSIGKNNIVFGPDNTFAIGNNNSINNQIRSIALGFGIQNEDDGGYSYDIFSIGTNLFNSGYGSFVIGTGVDQTNKLSGGNGISFGLNSTIPTMFVSPANGVNTLGNVGIGSTNPQERLDVNGGIRVGSSSGLNAGTIRFNGSDFEGYVGGQWKSFTAVSVGSGGSPWTLSGTNIYYNAGATLLGTTAVNGSRLQVSGGALPNASANNALNFSSGLVSGRILSSDANASIGLINTYADVSSVEISAGTSVNQVGAITISGGASTQQGGGVSVWTSGLERLRVAKNGNVGIGYFTPGAKLTLSVAPQSTGQVSDGIQLRSNSTLFSELVATGAAFNGYGVSGGEIWLNSQGGNLSVGPATAHHIKLVSGGAERMRITSTGNVGIGTINPQAKFQVVSGDVLVGNEANGQRWIMHVRSTSQSDLFVIAPDKSTGEWDWDKQFGIQRSTGKVFIGSITPTALATANNYRLYVRDGILTEKVKIALYNTASWADYVFDKEYKLASLNEVETFISKNKHLPGVPSAEEVVKQGLDLGEMDAILLKKIEELTLYILQQEKRIQELESAAKSK